MKQRNVAILVFDDVEVLDFCGPFEVFSVTGKRDGSDPFNVYTVAEHTPIAARNSLSVNPTYTLDTCPQPDILVVPGGGGRHVDGTPFGTRKEMHNETLLAWINQCYPQSEHILSVCTGALVLAKASLVENMAATTHHGALDELQQIAPTAEVKANARVVDSGKIIFSGGISAGIDAAFYLVAKLLGKDVALETATYMEYDWSGESYG
ncbi:DJ-1/PfpI family protein [Leptolyngbyaceae cyanobacterium CCMR0082]|uniref:DJ-1/PfpI family protein n=1 Tax=Adonisia turfae CCMR0082 TaxID=2304604 RepID=A0A6M0RZW8_9CYAN|nr:DJ-1/PfpI family protein [Adonisia turfae CCMR0082]